MAAKPAIDHCLAIFAPDVAPKRIQQLFVRLWEEL